MTAEPSGEREPPMTWDLKSLILAAAPLPPTFCLSISDVTMSAERKRDRIWWFLALFAIAISLVFLQLHRGGTSRNPSAIIVGSWYLDDLRTPEDENTFVSFHASGHSNLFPSVGSRWQYTDGNIVIQSWSLIGDSPVARSVSNTSVYSWFVGTHKSSFQAKLNDDGSVLTLISEESGPRCRLRRADL
jgi:hypothetical protein